jgi:hypothetical protein
MSRILETWSDEKDGRGSHQGDFIDTARGRAA